MCTWIPVDCADTKSGVPITELCPLFLSLTTRHMSMSEPSSVYKQALFTSTVIV
ncbi:hypothetical protein DPMN_059116 [Dreissena polymorpha]|uniref:Uncharacterized protein n=1 Tax=Dreissena polymorpha TaxID=45954 RepID=A0A9D4C3C0_DREPO|nr:hypothetical protein DPMN_059116 [Dreissena polymorpha]